MAKTSMNQFSVSDYAAKMVISTIVADNHYMYLGTNLLMSRAPFFNEHEWVGLPFLMNMNESGSTLISRAPFLPESGSHF